jgi:aspartyl-tRNA(Asn)/glutamyl-tRNA(Gln) amidotransferase subunit A
MCDVDADKDTDQLAYLSAKELTTLFRKRAISPVEVASQLLTRINRLDGAVNAVVHDDPELTLTMARAAECRYLEGSPLSGIDGVPVTVKDLCRVAGMPLSRGSAAFDGSIPVWDDGLPIARLREAGAVFLAKTATPDSGCKVVTRSAVHGVTANPYDLSRTPGGSSGGAAAALAMGFGPLAVGTDGAGSLRIPASYTNTVALKPSYGVVPTLSHDIDMPLPVTGPMARTVEDAATMLHVMSRPDARDPFAWPVPFSLPKDLANPDLTGLHIAASPRFGTVAPLADLEVDFLVAQATTLLADAGATLSEADPVWPVNPAIPFQVLWDTAYLDAASRVDETHRHLVDPIILAAAERAQKTSAATLLAAIDGRIKLALTAAEFFTRFDLLVGPVMPIPPFSVDHDVPEGFADDDWSWCPYTYIWNMTGQPAASVPIGFTEAGLPVGVQIIGRHGEEATILRAAAAIECRRPLYRRRPPGLSMALS